MNEKEPFEDIIASKFSEAEFPFDEGNWDNAEDMISAYRTKQKRRRIGFVFFSGIALGVLIMLPFVNRVNNTTDNAIAEAIKPSAENTDLDVLNEGAPQTTEQKELGDDIADIASPASSELKTIEEKVSVNTIPEVAHTNTSTVPNFRKAVKERIRKEKETLSSATVVPSESSSEPIENTDTKEEKLSVWDKIKNTIVLTQDTIADVVLVDAPEKPMVPPTSMLPWNVSAVAGANCVNEFSCNPIQGIEISKALKPYLEVGTGAYYTYLTIQSGGVKTIITHKEYGFGYKADVTEIKTDKLHYVVIPVYAKVNIDDKNSFIVGANMFTLLTVSNSLTSYKESYGQKQGTVSKKTTGYSNGINAFDIGLLVGYKRHLFWNIGAAVYLNHGLMDIKKNEYYNSTKFERNMSVQLMLTYKL